jgi:hypothetical protein
LLLWLHIRVINVVIIHVSSRPSRLWRRTLNIVYLQRIPHLALFLRTEGIRLGTLDIVSLKLIFNEASRLSILMIIRWQLVIRHQRIDRAIGLEFVVLRFRAFDLAQVRGTVQSRMIHSWQGTWDVIHIMQVWFICLWDTKSPNSTLCTYSSSYQASNKTYLKCLRCSY